MSDSFIYYITFIIYLKTKLCRTSCPSCNDDTKKESVDSQFGKTACVQCALEHLHKKKRSDQHFMVLENSDSVQATAPSLQRRHEKRHSFECLLFWKNSAKHVQATAPSHTNLYLHEKSTLSSA